MCAIVILIGRLTSTLSSLLVPQFERFWDSWGCLILCKVGRHVPGCVVSSSHDSDREIRYLPVTPYSILDTLLDTYRFSVSTEINLASIRSSFSGFH